MPPLSAHAITMLDAMENGRSYERSDLRRLAPELSAEAVREVMHELWLAHHVERFGDLGWRRTGTDEGLAPRTSRPDVASLRVGNVKPEDLFDHESFAAWFK